jgi:hypothetical protein
MNEPSPLSSNLPPKRKVNHSNGVSANSADETLSFDIPKKTDLANVSYAEAETERELIDAYEQLIRDEPREVVIDLGTLVNKNEPTAPVLADCVDPHTVPLQYLLDQARASAKTDDDDIPAELLEDRKEL